MKDAHDDALADVNATFEIIWKSNWIFMKVELKI